MATQATAIELAAARVHLSGCRFANHTTDP